MARKKWNIPSENVDQPFTIPATNESLDSTINVPSGFSSTTVPSSTSNRSSSHVIGSGTSTLPYHSKRDKLVNDYLQSKNNTDEEYWINSDSDDGDDYEDGNEDCNHENLQEDKSKHISSRDEITPKKSSWNLNLNPTTLHDNYDDKTNHTHIPPDSSDSEDDKDTYVHTEKQYGRRTIAGENRYNSSGSGYSSTMGGYSNRSESGYSSTMGYSNTIHNNVNLHSKTTNSNQAHFPQWESNNIPTMSNIHHDSKAYTSRQKSTINLHKKNLEYIRNLESSKSKMRRQINEEMKQKEKEKGFQLYLNGANNIKSKPSTRGSGRPMQMQESNSKRPRPSLPTERRGRRNWSGSSSMHALKDQEMDILRKSIHQWKTQNNTSAPSEDNELLQSMQQSLDSNLLSKIMGQLKKLNKDKQLKLLEMISGLADEDSENSDGDMIESGDDENEEKDYDESDGKHDMTSDSFLNELETIDDFQDDFETVQNSTIHEVGNDVNIEEVSQQSANILTLSPQNNIHESDSFSPKKAQSPVAIGNRNPLINALKKTKDESKVNMWLGGNSEPQIESSMTFSVHDNVDNVSVSLPETTEIERKIMDRPASQARRNRSPFRSQNESNKNNDQVSNSPPGQDYNSKIEYRPLSLRERRLARKQAKQATTLKNPVARYLVTSKTENEEEMRESFDSLMKFKLNNLGRLYGNSKEDSQSTEQFTKTESNVPTIQSYALQLQNPMLSEQKVHQSTSLGNAPIASDSRGYTPSSYTNRRPRPLSRTNSRVSNLSDISKSETTQEEVTTSLQTNIEKEIAPVVLPKNPRGRIITIDIRSTWGDIHYVGLSGIEIFDTNGSLIEILDPKSQVSADPPDINCLPQYQNDPRVVSNLFDGINKTCDDMHTWLAPFTENKSHFIIIDLKVEMTLGMIRFWNYNKSRIHSFRGARHVLIHLDEKKIFEGEIRKANGTLTHAEQGVESILFTDSPAAIQAIEEYDDEVYNTEIDTNLDSINSSKSLSRPKTGQNDNIPSTAIINNIDPDMRPLTAAIVRPPQDSASGWDKYMGKPNTSLKNSKVTSCQKILIQLHESWGDRHYIGLTGIEIIDENNSLITIAMNQVKAVPRDMNSISGHTGDYRTLDKLFNGVNITTDDKNMWLIPTSDHTPFIEIDLGEQRSVAGVRLYNYNKSEEDTFRGVKKLQLLLDGQFFGEFTVRKAPGHSLFDFSHSIRFTDEASLHHSSSIYQEDIALSIQQMRSSNLPTPPQDFQTPILPTAYVFKFRFLSTYGDLHYIGLNGIEFYDARHQKIKLTLENLKAFPNSIRCEIAGCENDQRTLDKLIDGVNNTWDDQHMFLSPFTVGQSNDIYVIFTDPVAVSCIKIWNYSKTPSRGAEEFEIYADDILFYKGFLRKAPGAGGMNTASFSQTIIFSNDKQFIAKEYKGVYSRRGMDNEVGLWNDGQPIHPLHRGGDLQRKIQSTSIRPKTMMTHG